IDNTSSSTITVSSFTMNNGTFTVEAATMTVGNGGFVLNSGTFTASTSSMTISSDVYLNNGFFNAGGSTITVAGNWYANYAAFSAGSGNVILFGYNKNLVTNASGNSFITYNNLTLSGTISVSWDNSVGNTLTISSTTALNGPGVTLRANTGCTVTITGVLNGP